MFEKFIELFFDKKSRKKKSKTYYGKKRERSKSDCLIVKRVDYEKTCLSVYFEELKGLNLSGRGYIEKVSDGCNRLKFLKSADFYR